MQTCNQCQKETPAGYFYQDFGLCWNCGREVVRQYEIKRYLAMSQVAKALKDGRLIKPNQCELCDGESFLVGHHWKGYDGPDAIDVLWVCRGCNIILRGRKYHNGSVSKEESRAVVGASVKARQDKINQIPAKKTKLKNYEVILEAGRYRYNVIVRDAKDQKIAIDLAKKSIIAEIGDERIRLLCAGRYYQP